MTTDGSDFALRAGLRAAAPLAPHLRKHRPSGFGHHVPGAMGAETVALSERAEQREAAGDVDALMAALPNPAEARIERGDSILYVNLDECTSCTACYQPDVCPVGAIYSDEHVPDGAAKTSYNSADPNKGHDHTFFIEHSQAVFAD